MFSSAPHQADSSNSGENATTAPSGKSYPPTVRDPHRYLRALGCRIIAVETQRMLVKTRNKGGAQGTGSNSGMIPDLGQVVRWRSPDQAKHPSSMTSARRSGFAASRNGKSPFDRKS